MDILDQPHTENVHALAERLTIADMEGVMKLLSDAVQHVVQTNSLPSDRLVVDCCVICMGVVVSPSEWRRSIHRSIAGPFLLHSGDQAVGPAGADASVSGLDESASTLSGIVTTEAVGSKGLTFTAFDLADNSAARTCIYNVIYDFGGYYPPVEPAPAFNPTAIGSAIPLKFSLAGDQGLDILAAGYPTAQPVDCGTRVPVGPASATRPAGKSGLSYDSLTGWYNYVWKTDKAWVGTCSVLTIQLSDGTQHLSPCHHVAVSPRLPQVACGGSRNRAGITTHSKAGQKFSFESCCPPRLLT